MSATGASFARGRSRQDYQTDPRFIRAVVARFGALDFDLAARRGNAQTRRWFGPGGDARDALAQDWTRLRGNLWCNPPFGHTGPWAHKCAESNGPARRILLLVPASVGSDWFHQHVHERALVLALNRRLRFVGADDDYPKDLILAVYGARAGFEVWRWR